MQTPSETPVGPFLTWPPGQEPLHTVLHLPQERDPCDVCGPRPSMNLLKDFQLSDYMGQEARSLPAGL